MINLMTFKFIIITITFLIMIDSITFVIIIIFIIFFKIVIILIRGFVRSAVDSWIYLICCRFVDLLQILRLKKAHFGALCHLFLEPFPNSLLFLFLIDGYRSLPLAVPFHRK